MPSCISKPPWLLLLNRVNSRLQGSVRAAVILARTALPAVVFLTWWILRSIYYLGSLHRSSLRILLAALLTLIFPQTLCNMRNYLCFLIPNSPQLEQQVVQGSSTFMELYARLAPWGPACTLPAHEWSPMRLPASSATQKLVCT